MNNLLATNEKSGNVQESYYKSIYRHDNADNYVTVQLVDNYSDWPIYSQYKQWNIFYPYILSLKEEKLPGRTDV